MASRSKFCIIGVPDHQAVINVGGRIGAARGPDLFRRFFYKMKGLAEVQQAISADNDVKNLTKDVATNHELAAQLIADCHRASGTSLVVGGGHDHGHSHLLGISRALPKKAKLACINIDAHLDVRKPTPLITSGSPFYLSLESGVLSPLRFVEFGIQSHCNGSDLWSYVRQKKVKVTTFDTLRNGKSGSSFASHLRRLSKISDAIVISLDLDALASAYSPGVSAPQSEGFTAMEIIEMMEAAGREEKVISLGIFELNPEHDLADQSSRLAATAAYHFFESKLLFSMQKPGPKRQP
jgi:formiminoglutamase